MQAIGVALKYAATIRYFSIQNFFLNSKLNCSIIQVQSSSVGALLRYAAEQSEKIEWGLIPLAQFNEAERKSCGWLKTKTRNGVRGIPANQRRQSILNALANLLLGEKTMSAFGI